jgi:twitching motility protein PilT
MLKLDFYVQHLVREGATALHLASGAPVRFAFPGGDRSSTKAIEHAQVVQVVEETAPPAVMDALLRGKSTNYLHVTDAGVRVTVIVEPVRSSEWTVAVRPGDAPVEAPMERPAERVDPARGGARVPDVTRPMVESPTQQPAQQRPRLDARPPLGMEGNTRPLEAPAAAAAPAPKAASPTHSHTENALALAGVRVDPVPGEPRINHYLRMMFAVGASDLHLSSDVVPLVRRHGEMIPLYERGVASDQELRSLMLDITPPRNKEEFAQKSDTDFAHTIEGLARFRANLFMDRKGIGGVFRQIPFDILPPEKLGIPPKVLELCNLSKGLVLVTGPTGSGKSTTLATLIDQINQRRADHIITIEDPIEFVHPNKKCLVNQREVGNHTQSFKAALRAALREDPDIVLVGEMRDLETIAIAIETAETGHLVFGTLHTTSAPSTVDRIIDQFPADRQEQIRTMLSESLRGVISQVLCKKKGGGRVAAYEVLITTPAVSNLIREGKTFQLQSVLQTGRALGMQTMNDHLLDLVKEGKVEAEEAYMKANDKQFFKDLLTKNNIPFKMPGS